MKKSDLSAHVTTLAVLSKAQAHSAVDALFSAIAEALAHNESVVLPGFGAFTTKTPPARQGRNPHTGDFRFVGAMNAAFRQIGNAVPPLLGHAVAEALRQQIDTGLTALGATTDMEAA